MIEFNLDTDGGTPIAANFAVSVIGIGGAGTNVLDRIALEGMPGAELICVNADQRSLSNSMAGRKVQIGKSLTQGLGAGGDPELGLEAAQSSEAEIRELIAGRNMVFICAGLGGGTGSGAAPYIAKLAKESGAFVVVFATLPFSFEGRRRQKQAAESLAEIGKYANALVTFENDRMGELVLPKKGIQEAFQVADKIIGQSVRAVTSLVTQPGLIRIGMDELITALNNAESRCLFGFGQAKGESRAQEAIAQALKSPLLNRGEMLASARSVLVHICGGNNMTLFEVETLMREISKHVHEDAQILFGAACDPKLGEHVSVTVLSSLSSSAAAMEHPKVSDHGLVAPSIPAAKPAPTPVPEPAPMAVPPAPSAPAARATPPVTALSQPAPTPVPAPQVKEEPAPAPVSRYTPKLKSTPPPVAPPPVSIPEPEEVEESEEEDFEANDVFPAHAEAEEAFEEEIDEEVYDEVEEEEEPEQPVAPPKKFAIRDVLMKPKAEPKPAAVALPAQPAAPSRSAAPQTPFKTAANQSPSTRVNAQQQTFDERLQGNARGRFEKTEPTVEEGEDLDVPTFLRKKR